LPILKLLASAVAVYYRGTPTFWEATLVQGHIHFSYGCDFMRSLGEPKLCTKFEIASFNLCINIKRGPANFRELP